jgi:hypothetical protein
VSRGPVRHMGSDGRDATEVTTSLRPLRSLATCEVLGWHSAESRTHGKEGVAGSIPTEGSTHKLTSGNAGQIPFWQASTRRQHIASAWLMPLR